MSKTRKNENGFNILEILLLIVVVIVISATGYIVYKYHHKSSSSSVVNASLKPTTSTGTTTSNKLTNPYVGWKTYNSNDGDFSFMYPTNWYVAGGGTGPSLGEISLEPIASQTTTVNAFRMTLWVVGGADDTSNPSTIPEGTVSNLINGIDVWTTTQDNATSSTSTGSFICPSMQIINSSQTHFSYNLSDGQYLTLIANYCMGQKDTDTYSYSEQVNGQDWQTGLKILGTIKFQ